MQLTPVIAIHMTAALGALVTGPVALWARQGATQRPRLHRAFGYAWVTLMLATAISALFIRDFSLPNIGGYTPIHLLVPVTFAGLFGAFWFLASLGQDQLLSWGWRIPFLFSIVLIGVGFWVRYRVEERKLAAENRLVLDQLTFGPRVESPDATKLPVLLAVALLRFVPWNCH